MHMCIHLPSLVGLTFLLGLLSLYTCVTHRPLWAPFSLSPCLVCWIVSLEIEEWGLGASLGMEVFL